MYTCYCHGFLNQHKINTKFQAYFECSFYVSTLFLLNKICTNIIIHNNMI